MSSFVVQNKKNIFLFVSAVGLFLFAFFIVKMYKETRIIIHMLKEELNNLTIKLQENNRKTNIAIGKINDNIEYKTNKTNKEIGKETTDDFSEAMDFLST